jgi:hypothetical protein
MNDRYFMTFIKIVLLEDYCGKEVKTDKFWTFTFDDETFSLESLPREPAHFFLQLVSTSCLYYRLDQS